MRLRWGSASFLCAAAVAGLVAAWAVRAAPPSGHALRSAADSDELQLARVAARVGDDVVLAALVTPNDSLAQLAAIRAAPYVSEADQTLLPLAAIAASRDPELAPLAATKLLRVAQDLVREGPAHHELQPRSLAEARAALERIVADETARPDIRLYAGQAAHLLGTIGVPASTPGPSARQPVRTLQAR